MPGFFRAHPFEPYLVSLSKLFVNNNDYLGGDLKRPERIDPETVERMNFDSADPVSDPVVDYEMQEDILYIYETDHEIGGVYLRGRESVWSVDYADTYQTMKTFEDADYYIAMWLEDLPADTYDLYLQIGGELQNTGKKITKQI